MNAGNAQINNSTITQNTAVLGGGIYTAGGQIHAWSVTRSPAITSPRTQAGNIDRQHQHDDRSLTDTS